MIRGLTQYLHENSRMYIEGRYRFLSNSVVHYSAFIQNEQDMLASPARSVAYQETASRMQILSDTRKK